MKLQTISLYPHMVAPASMDTDRRRSHALYMLADMVQPWYRGEAFKLRQVAGRQCPMCGEDMGPPGNLRVHRC